MNHPSPAVVRRLSDGAVFEIHPDALADHLTQADRTGEPLYEGLAAPGNDTFPETFPQTPKEGAPHGD